MILYVFFLSVVGHGIAVNDKNEGSTRLGCANITADSSLFVEKSLEYKKENDFSRYVNINAALNITLHRLH